MYSKNSHIVQSNIEHNKQKKINERNYKLKNLFIVIAIIAAFLIVGGGYKAYLTHAENNQQTVQVKRQASVVFFYKTNCPYCKEVFPEVLLAHQTGTDVQFVNMDNPINKHKYDDEFMVDRVPTFVLLNAKGQEVNRYVGTDNNKIKEIFGLVQEYK